MNSNPALVNLVQQVLCLNNSQVLRYAEGVYVLQRARPGYINSYEYLVRWDKKLWKTKHPEPFEAPLICCAPTQQDAAKIIRNYLNPIDENNKILDSPTTVTIEDVTVSGKVPCIN